MANQSSNALTLAALADPTRRAIFERLARRPAAVGEIASEMPVSRPAVSQHLRVLKEAKLVTETSKGARRIYRLDPRGIATMREWLDDMWSAALENFAAFADADGEPAAPSPQEKRKDK
jgi:DNA-binding transcriptional ArsR family regulator